jgi:hypothetical protein
MCRAASTTVALLLVLVAVVPASSQEKRLGELAESIRLNRPDGEPVVIDDQFLPPAVPPVEVTPYPERLATIVGAYRIVVRELETTLGELDRSMVLYDQVWRESVERICLRFEDLGIEVAAAAPDQPFAAAHEAARSATQEYAEAVAAVRGAIRNMTPTIGERFEHLKNGRLWLERAQALAEEARIRLELESPPEEFTRGESFDGGEAVCASRYPSDSNLRRECTTVQEGAVGELSDRTAFGLGLDDAAFNTIRNRCRGEWGNDYAGRNACEKRALAAQPPE